MTALYVCASSAELGRAERFIARARARGFTITWDWTVPVRELGHANPADATPFERRAWAKADLRGIDAADFVCLLYPERASFGAGFEMGYAFALRKPSIIAGRAQDSIFAALADAQVDTDDEALAVLVACKGEIK